MKKTLIFTFMIGMIGMFKVEAQDASIPDSFDCVPFTTSCGTSGLACGFSEAEIAADMDFWDGVDCGTP